MVEVIEPDQISVVLHIQCNHGNAAIVFSSAEYCSYYESHNEATHSEPVVLLEQNPHTFDSILMNYLLW